MTEIIGVRFKAGGKLYYFNPNGEHVDVGQSVIIETSKGVEFAECVQSNTMVDEMELVTTLRPMLRVATEEDFRQVEKNKEREKSAFDICQQKIQEHKLDMKLVEVKYSFDGSKILFFFTADGRVDFRGLVKDLAAVFHTRIELRQIGVRDEARMMGGLGICGRPFCCSAFLNDFQPVSIKMAKTQNISLNPTKISGACGRLMCCLKYEQDAYEDLLKHAPRLDSLVRTPDGIGVINQVNLLREQSRVTLDNDPDTPRIYPNSDLEIIRSGKGKRPAGYEKPEAPAASAPAVRTAKPAPVEAQEQSAVPQQRSKPRSNQNRRPGARPNPPKPGQEEEAQQSAAAQQRKKRRPVASAPAKPAEGAGAVQEQAQKSGKRIPRRRHRPTRRRSGEGGAPKAPEA